MPCLNPDKPPRSQRQRSQASRCSSFTSFVTAVDISERVASSDDHQQDDDSSQSESPEPFFHKRPSSADSLEKSPPTSQEDANTYSASDHKPTPRNKKSSPVNDTRFLSPSPTPRKKGKADRLSKASHLTLPYEQSQAEGYSDRRSSRLRGTRSSSRINSTYLEEPFEGPRRTCQSLSERGGSRSSRLPPLPLPNLSLRNSYMSSVAPFSPGSAVGSPRKRASRMPPSGPLSPRRDYDNASIATSTTAKGGKPSSVRITRVLTSESQVFPGTTIRKYVEPPLTEAMRSVLKQFSGRNMGDHGCNGYPIAVFVGATALDTGSLMHPHVAGGVSLYFGAGHPKNMATILPEEDRIPRHIPNPKAPTPVSLSRRAELRAAVTALETIYDLYRGKACAHICIDSAYVAKAWGTWIPTWELNGWPGEEKKELREDARRRDGYSSEGGRSRRRDERRKRHDYQDRNDWLDDDPYDRKYRSRRGGGGDSSDRGSRRGSRRRRDDYSSDSEDYSDYDDRRPSRRGGGRRRRDDYDEPPRRAPRPDTRKLVDEDLLRELADIRYEFAQVEMDRVGSAHLYLIDRTNNPADKMARAAVKSEGGLLAATADEGLGSESVLDEESEEEDVQTLYEGTRSMSKASLRAPRGSLDHRRSTALASAACSSRMSERGTGPTQKSSGRYLDTFIEEDEDARFRKSTRAEKERDGYLSKQLAPPAQGRYRDDRSRGSLDGLGSHSQPDFHSAYQESVSMIGVGTGSRPPAPEESEYNWDNRSTTSSRRSFSSKPAARSKPKQREWAMQTADDFAPSKGRKKRDDDSDKRSIFSRMSIFGRKGKSER